MSTVYIHSNPLYHISKYNGPRLLMDGRLSSGENLISQVTAKLISKSLFYPVETLKTFSHFHSEEEGVFEKFKKTVEDNGIIFTYSGILGTSLMELVHSLFSFGFHSIAKSTNNQFLLSIQSFIPFQLLLYPVEVAKAKMIAYPKKYRDLFQTLQVIHLEEGTEGLFKGIHYSLLEFIPNIIANFIAYEVSTVITTNVFKKDSLHTFDSFENITTATLSLFVAQVIKYPLDKSKAIVQAGVKDNDSVMNVLFKTGENYGLLGLYKGFSANLLKIPYLFVERSLYKAIQTYFLRQRGYNSPLMFPKILH